VLDLLGFSLRPGEPEQMVVGISAIPQPPIVRIVRVGTRQSDHPPPQIPGLGPVAASAGFRQLVL
jgi:hypothetical protein